MRKKQIKQIVEISVYLILSICGLIYKFFFK